MAINTDYTNADFDCLMDVLTASGLIASRELLTGEASGWLLLTTEQQEAQLIEATRIVNSMEWAGTRNDEIIVPVMAWPRSGLYETTGEEVDETEIPDQILNFMACLIMHRLIVGDPLLVPSMGVQSKTVDKISITYKGSGSGQVSGMNGCQATWIPSIWLIVGSSCMGVGSASKMRCP